MKISPILFLLCATTAPCFAGCSTANSLTLAPVGPGAGSRAVATNDGYLKVFTATHRVDVDFEAYFNPHASYRVEDASGRTVKFVQNHASDQDEAPDVVGLAPGRYNVIGESTWYGTVAVPVVIEQGKTTVVQLDGRWRGGAQNTALVHFPDGETVGWAAAPLNP
jgi:opacity protein-like surface antigen